MDNQQLTRKEHRALKRQNAENAQARQTIVARAKKYALGAVIVIVVIGVIAVLWRLTPQTVLSPPEVLNVRADDWIKGKPQAPVTLIEYLDFQCPACKAYHPVVTQIAAAFPDSVRIAVRHFPLRQIHQNAMLASRAAESAGRQGKFWGMHDLLFERQDDWSAASDAEMLFVGYAKQLGLNVEQFQQDLGDKGIKQRIETDYRGGTAVGVQGTPTFFLNGVKIQNPRTLEEFKSLIQKHL